MEFLLSARCSHGPASRDGVKTFPAAHAPPWVWLSSPGTEMWPSYLSLVPWPHQRVQQHRRRETWKLPLVANEQAPRQGSDGVPAPVQWDVTPPLQ